ncbi:hypothetical protein EJ04DRAFT_514778 [Polyplosphaeria fusca]|uniref:Uncharacterized protein n=1 Tax=Polyplosphaeria fusca TaxID=682080 RepID=A0A9P4QUH4_9PLEO|nr:hypothetical protein EJ04DRAFT_514778 [Polyplosphaeria fusca]
MSAFQAPSRLILCMCFASRPSRPPFAFAPPEVHLRAPGVGRGCMQLSFAKHLFSQATLTVTPLGARARKTLA